VRHQPLELSHQLVGAGVESARYLDADADEQVPCRIVAGSREPLPSQPKNLTGLRGGRYDDHRLPLRRRDANSRAAQRLPDADRQLAVHALTFADEERMVEDARAGVLNHARDDSAQSLEALLEERGVEFVEYAGWQAIDAAERAAGEPLGRPRVKLVTLAELAEAGRLPSPAR